MLAISPREFREGHRQGFEGFQGVSVFISLKKSINNIILLSIEPDNQIFSIQNHLRKIVYGVEPEFRLLPWSGKGEKL